MKSKFLSLLTKQNLVLCAFILLIIILKLPSFADPYWHPDEGIYSSIAHQLNLGGLLYTDAWDNKPPMIFYTYLIFYKIFGFHFFAIKFLGLMSTAVAFIYFYKLFRLLFKSVNILIPSLFFVILMCTPLLDGNVTNAENIFLALTTAGLYYFFLSLKTDQNKYFYIATFLYGLAFTFKIHPGIEFIAVFLSFLTIYFMRHGKNKSELLKIIFNSGIIFSIPYLFFIILFAIQGNLGDFLYAMFHNGVGYIKIADTNTSFLITILTSLPFRAILVLGCTGFLLYKIYNVKNKNFYILILILTYIIFAIFLSGREYSHYLLQAVTVFALLVGTYLHKYKDSKVGTKIVSSFAISAIFIGFAMLFFVQNLMANSGESSGGSTINSYFSYCVNYYPNYVKLVTGNISQEIYNKMFYSDMAKFYRLTSETKELSGTKTFLWDDNPWFYFVNDVSDPVKYVTSYHLSQENIDLNGFIDQLAQKSDFVLFEKNILINLPEDKKILFYKSFLKEKEFTDYILFKNESIKKLSF